jgi:hypothetical protein
MAYNAPNYMQQGSTKLVIGGEIDVTGSLKMSGTKVTATAAELNKMDGVTATAAQLNRAGLDATAALTNSAHSSTEGSTGYTTLAAGVLSVCSASGSTTGALVVFKLPTPAAGMVKALVSPTTHLPVVETAAKTININYTKTYHRIALAGKDTRCLLMGLSATQWAVVAASSAGVTLSTNIST